VNIGNYANPKVDKLLLEAQREMDETKRIDLYRQVQKVLMEEDAAFWPIVNDLNTIILAKKVKGFINPPEEWFQLSSVWIES
jgi:peptide/nickel transport system substrate-binding protein